MPVTTYARLYALLLTLLLGMSTHAQPIDLTGVDLANHTHDRWYLETIDDKPAGYWRTWMSVEDGRIISGYEELSTEKHGGEKLESRTRVLWTETIDFKPITIIVESAFGSDTVKQTYRFKDTGLEMTTEQNGRSITRMLPPIEGAYLTEAQSTLASGLLLKQGRAAFTLETLDPPTGMKPYTTRYSKLEGNEQSLGAAPGKIDKTTAWKVTYAILPGFESRIWTGPGGHVVAMRYEIDGHVYASTLADEKVVETAFDPPELSQRSVVVPDRVIKKPHLKKRIVYELSYRDGGSGVAPIETTRQSVQVLGKGAARVTVDLDRLQDKAKRKADRPTKAHLAATIYADHKDQAVRKLAGQAIAELDDHAGSRDIAAACKRMVQSHITQSVLSVGNATASEAARTRRGDCTEHAALLVALLRANGIPSRGVSGLVYSAERFVDEADVFVYHMWAQAWITNDNDDAGGYWLDLDTAMWRYTAGHIALGVMDLADNPQAEQIKLIPLTHGLTIKIKDVQ